MPASFRLSAFVALCCTGLLAAAPVRAQLSGSLTLSSDERFRGMSLSDGHPSLRLAAALDASGGWYGGAALSRTSPWPGHRTPQWTLYGGRSRRWSPTLAWEAGLAAVHFAQASSHSYAEAYAGLLAERWQARLYLSPDYFGRGTRSAYAELNARWPQTEALHLLAHAGVLGVQRNAYGRRARADLRLGAAYSFARAELQLAWSGAQRDAPYAVAYDRPRSGWSLSLALFF